MAPIKNTPPAVATEPPLLNELVFVMPFASNSSTRPNGMRHAISPVL